MSEAPAVLGIPVRYDRKFREVSETRGLWPWKKIIVGDAFVALEERARAAILLHEAAHAKLFHLEKRIAFAITNFWRPSGIGRYCQQQELQADAFATECGYGRDLALVFSRLKDSGGTFHPSAKERIDRIGERLRQSAIP